MQRTRTMCFTLRLDSRKHVLFRHRAMPLLQTVQTKRETIGKCTHASFFSTFVDQEWFSVVLVRMNCWLVMVVIERRFDMVEHRGYSKNLRRIFKDYGNEIWGEMIEWFLIIHAKFGIHFWMKILWNLFDRCLSSLSTVFTHFWTKRYKENGSEIEFRPSFLFWWCVFVGESQICNLKDVVGLGDKQILRLAAHRLGLVQSFSLVKRGMVHVCDKYDMSWLLRFQPFSLEAGLRTRILWEQRCWMLRFWSKNVRWSDPLTSTGFFFESL